MAGTHSKGLLKKDELTVSQLTGEKSRSIPVIIKASIITVTAAMLIFSIILSLFFAEGVAHKKLLESAQNTIKIANGMQLGIKTLNRENEDITSWLKINGTEIDYAVCASRDDFYKNHNQQRRRSRYGALYMTDGDVPQRVKGDKNLVIYGNNMSDGTMFASLKQYRKLRFYKENPDILFYFGDKKQQYLVFAVAIIDGENPAFDYKKSSFSSQKDFDRWYGKIAERSLIDTTVIPTAEDKFLTLVTDAEDFDGARLVVMARLVDDWDLILLDLSGAKVNAKAIYPEK